MADPDARFCVGFSSASKQAREGGGLPGYEGRVSRGRCLRAFLPPDVVRLIDALVRRLEHEDRLLTMHGGNLGVTLIEAAKAGGLRDVTFLVARGVDINYADEGGPPWTALVRASEHGQLAVVKFLLDSGAVELGKALHLAAYRNRVPVAALLLDRGADIEYGGGAALHSSAHHGHLEFVRLLLDRGANVNAVTGGINRTPLQYARGQGQQAVVALLLERGAVDL